MTIKDWLIIYNIKNLEKGVLELSKLGAPKQLIISYQKQLEDAKKGKLNIMYIEKTKNLDFSKIEVVKVEEVVGPKVVINILNLKIIFIYLKLDIIVILNKWI